MVSFASGSSGNCIYIGSDETHILIDAGISCKRILESLSQVGLSPEDISAVVITHEHNDHIKGLDVLARKLNLPLYATEGTIKKLRETDFPEDYPPELFKPVSPDVYFSIGDLELLPFSVSHDAADPVGYRVRNGKKQVGIATDMGVFSQYTIDHLQGLNAVLLEANHDINMLLTGRYPYYLKMRILSDRGHLSNENAGQLINAVLNDSMQAIMLGHLSKENNYEALAYEAVRLEIEQGDGPYRADDFPIMIAHRDTMSEIIYL